jgi:hypothetical protein
VVSAAALAGISLDPHGKGLIASVGLFIAIAGDVLAAHFHVRSSKGR